jgi:DsbC/DsbD-like thiol-disulfide interchange protein
VHRRRIAAAILLLSSAAAATVSLAAQTAATISRETRHLKFSASVSPRVIAPGQRVALVVDVSPKRGMHVYAPGSKYRPITIDLEPQSMLQVGKPMYPPATAYHFKPLNETVDVYQTPFRLLLDLAVVAGAPASSSITLVGTLEYQACDDHVCYLPESIPLQWALRVELPVGPQGKKKE